MEFLSQMWSLLGLLTILQNVLPTQLLSLLHSLWQSLQDSLTPYSYFDVPEFLGSAAVEPNALYRHVQLYLHRSLLLSSPPPPRLTLSLPRSVAVSGGGGGGHDAGAAATPSVSLSPNHSVADSFSGHRAVWTHHADTLQDSLEERRSFSLRLPKRHAAAVLPAYLAHLAAAADNLERSSRSRRLHTNAASPRGAAAWSSVPFCHPSTFDTLALEPDLKARLLADLTAFADGSEFYRRTGRPWKRGYLLHGPPGSGKSSLIAAMANHLRYDVFDLELTRVATNADLRALLIQTTNRSLIVIEDIDCSLHLIGDRKRRNKRRRLLHATAASDDSSDSDSDSDGGDMGGGDKHRAKVTLSGLLNFTDGLWSCCGEERIIVFTTNHVDGIDPALLRPGRMDVHVRLGACGAHAMRELVGRYVGVEDHEMLDAAECCVRDGAEMTPAEVGEVLLRNRDDPDAAVTELAVELKARQSAADELQWEDSAAELSDESPRKKGRKGLGWEGKPSYSPRPVASSIFCMEGGDVCTMADEGDAATRLAELCAMIDDHAAAGTMSEKRVATICAMIEECNAGVGDDDDVEASRRRRIRRRRSGRWWRRVDGTSNTRCYRQIGRISSGGFGVVVKAEHRDTGQTVAMKTLFPGHAADDDAGELLREACFMAACRGNPYLVGLHGVARNPRTKQYCLVMEYVGPSLSDALAEHVERHGEGYPEATVRRIMHQLLTGVEAMHERRIIHRDIKPSNILVGGDHDDVVKICDFGLAMSTAEAAAPYSQVGTGWYMAPEVLLDTPDYDDRVDTWSLGCVMAKLLSCDGEAPFQGKGTRDQLYKIFDVLGVPGRKTREAFKFRSKLLAYEVRRWRALRRPQPEQEAHGWLREVFPEKLLSQDGFDVLKGLLTFNPGERLTAAAALRHRWFAGADADESVAAALLRKTALIFGAVISAGAFVGNWMIQWCDGRTASIQA
uniref:Protein kinase domain-containing protein n=1 Tax=Oryza punctata TaxID=4537 RepID=A0A0E0M1U0_ORYPU